MNYAKPLTTDAEAEQFIRDLGANNKIFHLDDDPAEMVEFTTGKRTFTDTEAAHIRQRQDELFGLLEDPHELALEVSGLAGT